MSRLPAPELIEVRVEPSEDIEERKKEFFRLVFTAIRKAELRGNKGKKGE